MREERHVILAGGTLSSRTSRLSSDCRLLLGSLEGLALLGLLDIVPMPSENFRSGKELAAPGAETPCNLRNHLLVRLGVLNEFGRLERQLAALDLEGLVPRVDRPKMPLPLVLLVEALAASAVRTIMPVVTREGLVLVVDVILGRRAHHLRVQKAGRIEGGLRAAAVRGG